MRLDILTIFPEYFGTPLRTSIVGRAIRAGIVRLRIIDFRDFAEPPHRKVDAPPYGGGPGMVLRPEPIVRAVRFAEEAAGGAPATRVLLTPQGERFTQGTARDLATEPHVVVVCGHYEGFDERIRTVLRPREISIGDYILTGGESAALIVLDAVVRLLPGALGDPASAEQDSFCGPRLEGPQYTRPDAFEGHAVPPVLLSGDHAGIARWRREQSEKRTRERRPDLGLD